jgi:general secretion pathway protein N
MIDHLRPVGALLAAVAAWSLALLMLAVAGLGGRVGPHPGNAALAPAIPAVSLDVVGSRLGPASDYLEVGNRPLLAVDRRPAPLSAATGNEDAPLEATLTSVLITGDLKLAILQAQGDGRSQRVRLGDVLEGTAWRLVELEPRRAVFEGPEGRREMALRVFDGTGAPAPTPMAQPGRGGAEGSPVAVRPAESTASPQQGGASADAATPRVAEVTPEEQVEAIRRRIEARRAMRAAEGAEEQAASERAKQVK